METYAEVWLRRTAALLDSFRAETLAGARKTFQTELLHTLFPEGGFEGDYMDMADLCDKAMLETEQYGQKHPDPNWLARQIAEARLRAQLEVWKRAPHYPIAGIVGQDHDHEACDRCLNIADIDARLSDLESERAKLEKTDDK